MKHDYTQLKRLARQRVLDSLKNSRTLSDMYQKLKEKKHDEQVVRELFVRK